MEKMKKKTITSPTRTELSLRSSPVSIFVLTNTSGPTLPFLFLSIDIIYLNKLVCQSIGQVRKVSHSLIYYFLLSSSLISFYRYCDSSALPHLFSFTCWYSPISFVLFSFSKNIMILKTKNHFNVN